MEENKFHNKKIAVIGAGVEGLSSAAFLQKRGANVTIHDKRVSEEHDKEALKRMEDLGIDFVFGTHYLDQLGDYDMVVRSPGIKRTIIEDALKQSGSTTPEITSQMQLFFDVCLGKIIGVTGTKGKGTTSTLIYEMLKVQGFDAYLGGNIGTPPLDFLEQVRLDSWVVLELSSFQLQDLTKSPHIAVMLMTTSEHLDYHDDVYEYVDAKRQIFCFQTDQDFAVLNKDYPATRESDVETNGIIYWVSKEDLVGRGAYVRQGSVYIKLDEQLEEEIIATKSINLPGQHNWENVLAAVMAARLAGVVKKAMVQVLKEFAGLEHRLELVAEINGVTYYDDSFSTTPETAIAAITAFQNPEIVILGGSSKNSDFSELGKVISERTNIKVIIGIGTEWSRIKEAMKQPLYSSSGARSSHDVRTVQDNVLFIEGADSMEKVVKAAHKIAEPGDVVILSPACASFDMFKNYKERGNQFKEAVRKLNT